VKALIDSHVFLWLLFEPQAIGQTALDVIETSEEVFLSTVSLWELTLKAAKGKLPHDATEFVAGVGALGVEELPIEDRHLVALPRIDLPHGDPFDAMLVAQAQTDDLALITADRRLLASQYRTLDVRR